jgi:hypothetical protein
MLIIRPLDNTFLDGRILTKKRLYMWLTATLIYLDCDLLAQL